MGRWTVYILECADGSLYTGVTTDVARRLSEHSSGGPRAARYVRGRGPLRLIYRKSMKSQTEALQAEARIKRLPRPLKLELVKKTPLSLPRAFKSLGAS